MAEDFTGRTVGQYRDLEPIGAGGMANVYRAQQTNINRQVAVKIMSSDLAGNPDFVTRFRREADTIARLEHPHILPIHDYGEENGVLYLVTRLMPGGTLEDRIKQGPLPLEDVLRYARQLGSALHYAHQQGVFHRDLKPGNVLLDELDNIYLTDFGIAKMRGTATITQTGMAMGTPSYMAPEQWRGEEVAGCTDVYALGVMLYQMLTGELPFDAPSTPALMYLHLEQSPPSLAEKVTGLPPGIETVIHRALSKDCDLRFETALALVEALESAARNLEAAPDDMDVTAPALVHMPLDTGAQTFRLQTPALAAIPGASHAAPATADHAPSTLPQPASGVTTPQAPVHLDMRWLIGGGIVIVLALVALIALLVLGDRDSADNLAMVEVFMTATAVAQAERAATPTPVPATATDIVAATSVPAPTAVAMIGRLDEPFDAPDLLGWDRNEANRYFLEGRYHMLTLPGDGGSGISMAQRLPPLDNLRLEIEVEDLSEVETQVVYAVLFRVQDSSNFYRFTVTSDGQAGVIKRVNGTDEALPFTTVYGWDAEARQHTLSLEMVGPEMVLYVDDRVVFRQADVDLPAPGGIGLAVFREGAHVAWDDLRVEPIARLSDPPGVATTTFSEDFADNECQWPDYVTFEIAHFEPSSGHYHLDVPADDTGIQVRCANSGLYQNARIEVTILDISEGQAAYGLVFRQNALGNDYYRLVVNSAGQVSFQKYLADDPRCQPCTLAVEPLPGYVPAEAHRLAVEAFESTLRGFVDGALVIEVEDRDITEPGIVRLGAYQPGAHIAFDDLLIEPIDRLSDLPAGARLPEVAATLLERESAPLIFSAEAITVSIPQDAASPAASQMLDLPQAVQDFVFRATLRFEADSPTDLCGLVFRANNPSPFHWLNLSRNGTLLYGDHARLPADPLVGRRLEGETLARGEAVDVLIMAQGEAVYLALDGAPVEGAALQDDAPTSGGLLVWVFLSANNAAECRFEDVAVWSLDE